MSIVLWCYCVYNFLFLLGAWWKRFCWRYNYYCYVLAGDKGITLDELCTKIIIKVVAFFAFTSISELKFISS